MEIQIYSSASNVYYVNEFLKEQDTRAVKKIWDRLDLIRKYGYKAFKALSIRKITDTEIWELKIWFNNIAYRIFFIIKESVMWLLHAFCKTSEKTPQRHIKTAKTRLIDLNTRVLAFQTT